MCILSFIRKKDKIIITHNRDEDKNRKSSTTLVTQSIHNQKATFPKDLKGGGTWILHSPQWITAMLNGADTLHHRREKYKRSRGLFPFELLKFNHVKDYKDSLELNSIEPFTQFIFHQSSQKAFVLRWNEIDISIEEIHENLMVLSSSTLYSQVEKDFHFKAIQSINNFATDNLTVKHQSLFWDKKETHPLISTTSLVQVCLVKDRQSMFYKRF